MIEKRISKISSVAFPRLFTIQDTTVKNSITTRGDSQISDAQMPKAPLHLAREAGGSLKNWWCGRSVPSRRGRKDVACTCLHQERPLGAQEGVRSLPSFQLHWLVPRCL